MRNIVLLIFVVFALNTTAQNTFELEFEYPDTVKTGTNFQVKVSFKRPDMSCYAFASQKLTPEITATDERSGEAVLKNENNRITYTWFRTPERYKFSIRYNLKVDKSGTYTLPFDFVYMYNQYRGNITYNNFTVTVKDDFSEEDINATKHYIKNNKTAYNKTDNKNNTTNNENTVNENKNENTSEQNMSNDVPLSCKRTITLNKEDNSYIVTLEIKKQNFSGTVKITENLSEEAEVYAEQIPSEAILTQSKNLVEITWNKIPADNMIVVKYKIISKNSIEPTITGKVKYIYNYALKEVNVIN